MSAEPLLDIATLIAPIAGENPAGEPIAFTVRKDLERLRKEITADDATDDDPIRSPDWQKIVRIAKQTLTDQSKDLLVAARLTEALTKLHGFPGLAEGLALMRGLVDDCWDRMYPVIEDGDLEVRAGPFDWLGEADRGALFPYTIRTAPMVVGGPDGGYGWWHWRESQDGKEVSREDFDRAVATTTREHSQAVFDAINRAITEFTTITQSLNGKMGSSSPGMSDFRSALAECRALAQQILQLKGPAPAEAGETAEASSEGEPGAEGGARSGGGDAAAVASRTVATRAELYRRLQNTAQLLGQMEPHSPIPYLILKAIELGNLPFPQLMRALIRDEGVIGELNRELGIKETVTEG